MIVYFVTGGSDDQSDSLTKMGVEHRLISYWYLKGKKKNFIPDYVERGTGRDPRKGDVPVQRRFRQKFRGGHKPGAYNCERMNQDPDKPEFRRSLYEKADSLESVRMFEMAGLKPEDQLQQLKSEIEFRVKITKNEIFKIGECLMHVKRICQQEKISFQQWISEHLDFSYETANNFMNVFKNCLGERGIAMAISPSILYTIAAPSFPEELRKHLLDSGKLEEITGGQLKKLLRKYKEGGFEAIQEDVDELSRVRLARNQIRFTFDMCENAMRTLKALREKMEKRGVFQRAIIPFEDAIKTDEPEAYDINAKLYSALNKAIDILDQAQEESSAISNEIHKRLVEIHGTVAS